MTASDVELLEAAAGGDADAFGMFFRRHERAVTSFAVRRCATPDDVADLVADTFLVALSSAHRYTPVSDSALPWLLGIGMRLLKREWRARLTRWRLARRVAGSLPRYVEDEADGVIAAIDAARHGPDLERAMASLSSRDREVLELVAFEGLEPGEAALALGVSANAARLRLSRARAGVRGLLDENALHAVQVGGESAV